MTPEMDRTSDPSFKGKTSSTGTGASSQHSSLSASAQPRFDAAARRPRKLRSQYPRGSTENHVEYILVASFDIDRGPVMEHQYPVAITGDEHMLAELMLPDQAHVRNQDWTIFFLHKDTSQEEDDAERQAKQERRARRNRKRDRARGVIHESDDEDEQGDLDDDDDDWDDDESTDSEPEGIEGPPLVYVLNLVNTKQDKTVKRGAVVKAMAICTRHPFLHIYKVRESRSPLCKTTNPRAAAFIIGLGRVLQGTRTRNTGNALRCGERDGLVADAKAHLARETSPAIKRE
jgi:hypothetical protein